MRHPTLGQRSHRRRCGAPPPISLFILRSHTMKRALFILPFLMLCCCGRNNAASTAASDVQEHAPAGDPATLPKVPAQEDAIRKMIRERFGDATARNLRINVEVQP